MRNLILTFLIPLSLWSAEERFPTPTKEAIEEAANKCYELGQNEVFSLSYSELANFVLGRYYYGVCEPFNEYGCNPSKIGNPNLPAVLLIHASNSNQGSWIPLLYSLKDNKYFNIFSFNYKDETALEELIQKIEAIRNLYIDAGSENLTISLVGHSLGGIIAAEYSYDEDLLVPGTTVDKVITIAARLKNPDRPIELPLYPYCYDVLERVEQLSEKMNKTSVKLHTIAAEKDWLVPLECALIGENQVVIPSCGHVLVTRSSATHQQVINWLRPSE